ncbi:D-beta-hydroxybutyrate dehydrogenase, mitochondrial-like [Gigantopelta aegis]|uniref:D-beta-hydroxybutyrate dehydrogenase, mitochondrial-like n=1 Tax=Gigantopelta aegis TaxID=1735272 RepID=UPI001B88C856|nr:D-beta-hydroxybutyrate dehydrogenase, mitochondrial-like [Gigantopelta aegis]
MWDYWDLILCGSFLLVLLWLRRRYCQSSRHGWLKPDGRFVLITGCDTGFGHALAKRLDERGCNVFATCLLEQGEGAKELRRTGTARMRVIPLDVSSDESVQACLRRVREAEAVGQTGLWAVVNNAGINLLADVEFCTMDMYKRVAEVNLFGMIRVCKAFLALIRESKGIIVNVTSIKGLISDYHSSAYVVTKYGGEGFSDALRVEMKRFGVTVCLVEPGNFGVSTGMMNKDIHKKNYDKQWEEAPDDIKQLYGYDYLEKKLEHTVSVTANPSIEPVLDAMEAALFHPDPEVRYVIPGGDGLLDKYTVFATLKHYLPYKMMDYLVEKYC